ncbi:proline racemase family protein [Pseudogulbenkiania subflava]|uniref:Proline racemase n=1 Tax=Pseudogulbenkiania subflava DSM 22618 TaxID=1123014 RepID=A0A1Y6BSQ0_9NEIS|nr:proline racemase family protein [Pseudogulbenkiania subflava]SMF26663.1 Proline racemase [Pseudogulbenkiania subflava DSM 22618]
MTETWQSNEFDTIEMHTGGEPVRIIPGLLDAIRGDDILAKHRDMRDRLDGVRRMLMFEPALLTSLFKMAML